MVLSFSVMVALFFILRKSLPPGNKKPSTFKKDRDYSHGLLGAFRSCLFFFALLLIKRKGKKEEQNKHFPKKKIIGL